MIEPLRIAFEVDCPPAHAFDLWTQRASSWWPAQHTVSADPAVRVVFEARLGGRVFEQTPTGDEVDWGQITVWDPPHRLGYSWFIRTDRADATDVEIRFQEQGDDRTRVEIEHRGWERLGSRGPRWRTVNQAGWDGVLPDYIRACSRVATTKRPAG
jgi:hypothetical protein